MTSSWKRVYSVRFMYSPLQIIFVSLYGIGVELALMTIVFTDFDVAVLLVCIKGVKGVIWLV